MRTDNQQERPSADWISGFVDGEGCFHVAINRQPKMKLGWQVLPEFRVVQHQKDVEILQKICDVFGCGQVVTNHAERKELRVRGLQNLQQVVTFFQKHPLQTSKRVNFQKFARILEMMQRDEHQTKQGLLAIAELAATMNRKVHSKALGILRDCTPESLMT